MEKSFRKYLPVDFFVLLITFFFLVIKIRPFTTGGGIILTIKQVAVLLPLLILVVYLGIATFIIFPRRPQGTRFGSFLSHHRALGWTLGIACFAFVIVGTILVILAAADMIRLYGGLYTQVFFPASSLVCIQTILYLGEVYDVGVIKEAIRIANKLWHLGGDFTLAFWKFICRKNLTTGYVPQLLENSIYIFLPLWFYSRLFKDPINLPYGLKALDFRYGYIEVLGYVLLGFLLAYLLPGWLGQLVGLGLVLYLFALPLSGLWENAYNESNIIRGLIPWNDANGYFQDANRLLDGQLISLFSAKRPLFTGMLSFLLLLTDRNLQSALLILAAINAVSCYYAAREVQRTHGTLPAVLMISISFFFYRRFSGTTLTEPLGLVLGMTSFALLWRGASIKRSDLVLAGIFLASLSLLARSGAYFTLPFLVLWASWLFRKGKRFSLPWLGYATSAVIAAFAINFMILRMVGVPGASSNFNFSYTFYGMVSGGESWNLVLDEHPELITMSEPETSQRIYELAFNKLRQNPGAFFQGVIKAGEVLLQPKTGLFSFIRSGYSETGLILTHYLLLLLSTLGMFLILIRRRDVHAMLLCLTAFGILISVPFAPPWDADYMRVYASSLPFIAVLPSIGLMMIVYPMKDHIKPLRILNQPIDLISPGSSLILGIILVVVIIFGTLGVRFLSHSTVITDQSCPSDKVAVFIRSSPGSNLIIWDDSQLAQTWVPNVRYGSFIGGHNLDFPFPEILTELASVKPDSIMISGYDLKSGSNLTIFSDRRQVPPKITRLQACGNWSRSSIPRQYGFFYATTLNEVIVR